MDKTKRNIFIVISLFVGTILAITIGILYVNTADYSKYAKMYDKTLVTGVSSSSSSESTTTSSTQEESFTIIKSNNKTSTSTTNSKPSTSKTSTTSSKTEETGITAARDGDYEDQKPKTNRQWDEDRRYMFYEHVDSAYMDAVVKPRRQVELDALALPDFQRDYYQLFFTTGEFKYVLINMINYKYFKVVTVNDNNDTLRVGIVRKDGATKQQAEKESLEFLNGELSHLVMASPYSVKDWIDNKDSIQVVWAE